MAQTCMAASGTGSQVFIDNVTKDRNGPMNFEVYMETLSDIYIENLFVLF